MTLILEIAFVAHQDLHDIGTGVLSHFTEPGFDVLERLTISNIVDEDATMSTFVIGGSDGFESWLAAATSLGRQCPRSAV